MPLLLLAAALTGGLALCLLGGDETRGAARLAEGGVLGLTLLGLVGFALSFALGPGAAAVAGAGALLCLPAVLVAATPRGRARLGAWLRAERRDLLPVDARRGAAAAGALLACLALGLLMQRTVIDRDGVLGSGVVHNLGDLPFHMAIVQSLAVGDNVPPQHPELAGQALTYPFLTDFVASQFVVAGGRLARVLDAQSAGLAVLLLILLYRWARDLTGDALAAVLAPALVLLSGGLGFVDLFSELHGLHGSLLAYLGHLPHDYTIRSQGGLRFGNVVTVLLVPQRAWLLGLPLALMAWRRWWLALEQADERKARRLMAHAGIAAGLLPLAHTQSFAVVVAAAIALALLFRRRVWWPFFGIAALLALPQVWWLASRSTLGLRQFVAWQPGWESGDGSFVWFWLRNAGVFVPLLLVALAWRGSRAAVSSRRALFWLPFAGCFVIPNLLRLSPWIWDNMKYLLFWLLASAPLVALLLARLARWRLPGVLASASLVVVLTASGGLDLWRVASGASEVGVFGVEARAFAALVADRTPPHARILTAPAFDHPVLLSGRCEFLGYEGHIWSQGLDAGTRRSVMEAIYAGRPDALQLARAHHLDYVTWGPQEQHAFGGSPLVARLPVVAAIGPYSLHRLAPPPESRAR